MRSAFASDMPLDIPGNAMRPGCPLQSGAEATAECAQPLELKACLEQMAREAEPGEVNTGRYRCRYVTWGQGPNLVLIPGMASDAAAFVMLMARLRSHFRCTSYDLPDGVTDGARLMNFRHADLVDDLFFLLDHLRIQEASLLGHSFGSTIALDALHRQAWRFSRAVLQGGFAYRPLAWAEVFVSHWLRFLPGRIAHLPLCHRVVERNHREPFRARAEDVWDFYLERQDCVPIRAFAHRALMLPRLDLRPNLASIHQPILMVCGEHDPLVGRRCELELTQGLPCVARAEIENCGHNPHLSHPEVLAEIIRQFLLPASCHG